MPIVLEKQSTPLRHDASVESNLFRGLDAVLRAKMPVGTHRERASVCMSEPSTDSRDIDPGLDASRGEQMTQIVMSQVRNADLPACAGQRLGRFADLENWSLGAQHSIRFHAE
jgi:hypothetical protein